MEKEEIKLSLCRHDKVVYLENLKGVYQKTSKLINGFSKTVACKINIRKL